MRVIEITEQSIPFFKAGESANFGAALELLTSKTMSKSQSQRGGFLARARAEKPVKNESQKTVGSELSRAGFDDSLRKTGSQSRFFIPKST